MKYTKRELVIIDVLKQRISDLERKIAELELEKIINRNQNWTVRIKEKTA